MPEPFVAGAWYDQFSPDGPVVPHLKERPLSDTEIAYGGAENLPPQQLPGPLSLIAHHPGALTYRVKSPEKYDADQRRAYVLERIGNDPELVGQLKDAYEPYAARGYAGTLPDGTQYRVPGEYFGNDSPIWRAAQTAGAATGARVGLSQGIANEAGKAMDWMLGQEPVNQYPQAWSQMGKEMGRLVDAIALDKQKYRSPRQEALNQMRADIDARPWQELDPRPYALKRSSEATEYQKDGVEAMREARVWPGLAEVLGQVINITTDPFSSLTGATKLARAGQSAAALRGMGADAAFGLLPLGIQVGNETVDSIRELTGRK